MVISNKKTNKTCYIIAGPNGAGKTTFAMKYLPSIEFSEKRVHERVQQGGHNIPIDAIKRRYSKSISNLFNLYMPLCDYILCFDNSTTILKPIFEKDTAGINMLDNKIYDLMRKHKNG